MSQLNGIYVDTDGNISCRKGDSGSIGVLGIPTDDNYKVTLGVYDPATKEILAEVSGDSDNESELLLPISVDFTEGLGVGRFFYGVKLTDSEHGEQTVIPNSFMNEDGFISIGSPKNFTVRPKLVEGAE